MTTVSDRRLLWTPRVLGILLSLFIGMFALDAFSDRKPFVRALADFGMHLVPALIVLAIAIASFKREWIGGLAFTGLAVVYALTMSRGRVDWMVAISGPLLLVGVLFLVSWFRRGGLHAG